MPQVNLQKIDGSNWRQCAKLKVAPEQEHFVASNAYSLAEAAWNAEGVTYYPLAIYDSETNNMVGFVMYIYDPADHVYFICRLMVDRQYQAKGYGRAALLIVLDLIKKEPDCTSIGISYEPENSVADKLYESLGFRKTGEIRHGEVVAELKI